MSIKFPVFVLAKDSGEVLKFDSIEQMQNQMERIDVENGEYQVWDREGRSVNLSVQKPLWLSAELGGEAHRQQLVESLRKYAEAIGTELQVDLSSDLTQVYDQIKKPTKNRRKRH